MSNGVCSGDAGHKIVIFGRKDSNKIILRKVQTFVNKTTKNRNFLAQFTLLSLLRFLVTVNMNFCIIFFYFKFIFLRNFVFLVAFYRLALLLFEKYLYFRQSVINLISVLTFISRCVTQHEYSLSTLMIISLFWY